nr:hypothetical protein [Tanacetum cinerariifolium]
FDVLGYYQIHISQLSVIGAAKAGEEYPQCYSKPLDSLKNWNNRFFWVDECVFLPAVEWRTSASKDGMPASGTYSVKAVRVLDTHQMDLFSLIRAPNPTKVKTGSRPRAPNELPLLTLTASRVIEMDEPAVATNSSGVPSAIEKSPLDFADEAEAFGQETAAPEVSLPEEVPVTNIPRGDQAAPVVVEPSSVQESRKRGREGIDANAPPNDPDPLAFADAPSPRPADVIRSSQGVAAAEDLGSENVSSPTEIGS